MFRVFTYNFRVGHSVACGAKANQKHDLSKAFWKNRVDRAVAIRAKWRRMGQEVLFDIAICHMLDQHYLLQQVQTESLFKKNNS
jgi:hypothetical protein